jgi:hypothetical protein
MIYREDTIYKTNEEGSKEQSIVTLNRNKFPRNKMILDKILIDLEFDRNIDEKEFIYLNTMEILDTNTDKDNTYRVDFETVVGTVDKENPKKYYFELYGLEKDVFPESINVKPEMFTDDRYFIKEFDLDTTVNGKGELIPLDGVNIKAVEAHFYEANIDDDFDNNTRKKSSIRITGDQDISNLFNGSITVNGTEVAV